ncbi:unnamed protein product [Brassica oleracea var. botrytis]
MLTNEAGEVTSHLQGMFNRTIRLLEAGIKPVYVFDGKPPELKRQEIAKRADATADLTGAIEAGNKEDIEKCSKRTVKVTKQHNDDCKRLLRLMGVPVADAFVYIQATSEAEAQCAALCQAGKVYGVASEDMDSLTFGAPKFLRHLMDPSSRKIPVMEFEVAKVYPRLSYTLHLKVNVIISDFVISFQILEDLQLTMDQFIDLCILSGCDYCDSIRGIFLFYHLDRSLGTNTHFTALKLIRQHGSIETILENINKDRYQIPEEWPYNEARKLFKEPDVLTDEEQLDIKWISPDEDGIVQFLVNENGFKLGAEADNFFAVEKIKSAKNKSSQGRLESFFKPVANSSMPAKRKQTPESNTKGATNKKTKGGGGGRKKK